MTKNKCNDDLLRRAMEGCGKPPGHPTQDMGNHAAISAYAIAVANGFRGTVKEWLDSLKGVPGPQGAAFTYDDFTPEQLEGLIGPVGPDGPIGPTGPTGPAGADGVSVTLDSMYYFRYDDNDGHLYVGVADDADPPPLSIDDNGHMIYEIS